MKKKHLKEKAITSFQLLALKGGTTGENQSQGEANCSNTGAQNEHSSFSSVDEQFVQDAGWIRL